MSVIHLPDGNRAGLFGTVGISGLILLVMSGGGCAAGGPTAEPVRAPEQIEAPQTRYEQEGQRIAANPVTYLREVYARVDALGQYQLRFYRQERLGGRLRPLEHIRAWFRKEPFSVKFVWEDEDADYYESVYVANQNAGKLIVRERKGALPLLPPTTRKLDPMLPVKLGRARNPITDFGLARVTARTLLPFEDPALNEQMTIEYQGLVRLEPQDRPAHHLRIDRPRPVPGIEYTRQDFYVDADTGLPAGTDLYLPAGELGARYRYAEVDFSVQLSDADFELSTAGKK